MEWGFFFVLGGRGGGKREWRSVVVLEVEVRVDIGDNL